MLIKSIGFIGIAIIIDWIIGDPPHWPHPVRWIGRVISFLEKVIRKRVKNLYLGGALLWIGVIGLMIAVLTVAYLILPTLLMDILSIYLLYTALATRCLADEASKVKKTIENHELEASRDALSYLVGRDTQNLTEPQVSRAIVETVSENTIDGILAPLFYMLVLAPFGLSVVGAMVYKCVNTLDSMVGYVQEPYTEIGYVSAKMDDILNWIPARLGAMVMLVSGGFIGGDTAQAYKILKRDHRNHKSPNCAYPESVTAGLLNIQLGGTNTYFGEVLIKPTIGDPVNEIDTNCISFSVFLIYVSEVIFFVLGLVILSLWEVL